MRRSSAPRPKHVAQRTCVGCRQVLPKRTLMRVVRTATGVQLDPTGKAPGRGAYLHDRRACWERALAGTLAPALRMDLTADDRERLQTILASLPMEGGQAAVGT
jgi:predicted RNA-binding protein YlxR (DUF448 family)